MGVLCIGQAVYDITLPVETAIEENQKYRIFGKFECIGGPACNAAYLCAKWQADTTLLTRIGDDVYGNKIIQDLNEIGVQTKYIQKLKNYETPLSIIINNQTNGSRTILNNPGVHSPLAFRYPKTKVILVDGHELDISMKIIKENREAISILDAGTYREPTHKLACVVDYLICSQDFAFQYTNIKLDLQNKDTIEKTFAKLRELNKKHIVVTVGEHGLLYSEHDDIHHLPAFKAKVIDTTGAGDIFHGAFAYCMDQDIPYVEALRIASMASSISVGVKGGMTSIPTLEVVMEKMKLA